MTYIDPRLEPITSATYGICIYQEQYLEIAKQIAGFTPAEADDLRKAIGKKIHSLMASLKEKFLEGCAQTRHDARGREPALEGHGAVAGLLLQQGARRVLRADRVPHRVAARAPSARVHGGAHLVGDEHEGPRAVLRQRVPRDGDRGAAARRQLLAVRLRGRRGKDPLRPQRGEERRRQRRARDRRRARAGRAVRVDLGLHRARRPGASRTSARSSRSSSAARSTRPALAQGDVRRARAGARVRATRARTTALAAARARSSTSASRSRRRPKHHPPIPTDEWEKNELLRLEKETLGLYVSEHPLAAVRDQLRRKTELHARRARAPPRRRHRHRRRHRRGASSR